MIDTKDYKILLAVLVLALSMLPYNAAFASSTNGLQSCSNFNVTLQGIHQKYNATCSWSGGSIAVTMGAGQSGYVHVLVVGSNGNTYINAATTDWCVSPNKSIAFLPKQDYTVLISTGMGGGYCASINYAIVRLSPYNITANTTTQPTRPVTTIPGKTGIATTQSTTTIPFTGASASTSSKTSGNNVFFVAFFILLMALVYAYIIKRKFSHKKSAFSNHDVLNSMDRNNASSNALMQNPKFKEFMQRNPRLAKKLMNNPYFMRQMKGRSNRYNSASRRTLSYSAPDYDTFDGM